MTPPSAVVAAAPPLASLAIGRGRFFFWLFLLAAANGIAGMAIQWTIGHGLERSLLDLFGISAVVWVAFLAGLTILREAPAREPLRPTDMLAGAIVVAAAVVPMGPASAVSLSLLSVYAILTSLGGSPLRRAAIIFLALTGTLIWGRLLLALFSRPLLSLDTWFAASLVGTERRGNLLAFADGSGILAIAPGCSSLQGMSITILFWALVNQWFKVRLSLVSLGWLAAALTATIAINAARVASMALFPEHLQALHDGIGWHLFAWTTLIAVASICLYGARHEVLARD